MHESYASHVSDYKTLASKQRKTHERFPAVQSSWRSSFMGMWGRARVRVSRFVNGHAVTPSQSDYPGIIASSYAGCRAEDRIQIKA